MGPYELLQKVITAFEALDIRYIVTGSVASMAYGEPRLTNDIDIVADIKIEQIAFLERYFPHDEFYFDRDMAINTINHKSQFNIIHPASGLKVDIIVYKDTEFDRARFARSKRIQPAEEYQANFAAPEDVIIKKMEYYKEGDLNTSETSPKADTPFLSAISRRNIRNASNSPLSTPSKESFVALGVLTGLIAGCFCNGRKSS